MEITGRIIAVLPVQGGISKNGNEWKKQEYVLETHDQYPKKVCFQIFGADRIDQAAIQPGEELTEFFDIDSREYQGRWFTNINAWKRIGSFLPKAIPFRAKGYGFFDLVRYTSHRLDILYLGKDYAHPLDILHIVYFHLHLSFEHSVFRLNQQADDIDIEVIGYRAASSCHISVFLSVVPLPLSSR